MGGRSRSSQATTNKQSTANIVNDGDYAGVGGNVTHDESRVDFDIDNSVRNDVDYDIDNSVRNDVDYDIDNSVRNDIDNDIDNSYTDNTDNSTIYDGEFSGAGTVNILDAGAIESSFDFGESAINANKQILIDSVNAVSGVASDAVNSVVQSQSNAYEFAGNAQENTINALSQASESYAENLSDFANVFAESISDSQLQNTRSNTEQLNKISELAKSTALGGQDIVAKSATNIGYAALGISGVIVLFVMFRGGK